MSERGEKILVAMSGGVDSSTAALLIRERGYRCTGVMLKLHGKFTDDDESCGSAEDIKDAQNVADRLGMEFCLLDREDRFEREVISRFVSSYMAGETPNPCVECNRYMKFGALFEYAREHGCEYIVTGHYARVEYDPKYGRRVLKRAIDETKDQSYVLYSLTKDQLEHVIFPLGEYTKAEIRNIAEAHGLVNAKKKESQDICFVPDGKYVDFICRYTGKSFDEGNFVDSQNNVIGRHKGIVRYTVGQHKKLGIVTEVPLYVDRIEPESNTITLVTDGELYKNTVTLTNMTWSAIDVPKNEFRAEAKIRYRHKAAPCTVKTAEDGVVTLVFDEAQRAPAKGQAAVIYDGDTVLGGGVII